MEDIGGNIADEAVDRAGYASDHRSQRSNPKERATSSPSSERGSSKKAIGVACWPCRKRKAKCTGERPICAPCLRRGAECAYEHEEGLTRAGSLEMRLHESIAKSEILEYLFDQLRTRSDEESAMLLAVIRLGADMNKIVAQLKSAPQLLLSRGAVPDMNRLMKDGSRGEEAPIAMYPPSDHTTSMNSTHGDV